mgnify:CR=1 FL=1
MAPKIAPKSFGTFEKQAPGLRKNPASSSNAQNGSAAWVTLTARLPLSNSDTGLANSNGKKDQSR